MAYAERAPRPLGEMNTTPLIDVLLVLLVMFIMTIPVSTHSLDYDLPRPGPVGPIPDRVSNVLTIDAAGQARWNGTAVADAQLADSLEQVSTMMPEPEIQYRPDALASYDRSAHVLAIVKQSGVSRFGFAGNEQYRDFNQAP